MSCSYSCSCSKCCKLALTMASYAAIGYTLKRIRCDIQLHEQTDQLLRIGRLLGLPASTCAA